MLRKIKSIIASVMVLGLIFTGSGVFALGSDFNQTINAGTLIAEMLDASKVTVGSPAVTMSAQTFSFDCLFGGSASTGSFGTNTERIYVTNPDAADGGWNLGLAATGGTTDTWNATGGDIDFNDPTGGDAGCADGADGDAFIGQLSVDPTTSGTITTDCGSCTATSVSKGSSSAYNEGTVDSIVLMTGAAGSDDIWRGYLTGVDMSQTIPAETPADAFTLNLTITATTI